MALKYKVWADNHFISHESAANAHEAIEKSIVKNYQHYDHLMENPGCVFAAKKGFFHAPREEYVWSAFPELMEDFAIDTEKVM